jgi:glycosyltransferase involved in cell wall biosynthesis
MKILSLTAGAANMYCGSCLRDNALAGELIRQGHDVTLMPVYTPTKTDESNASAPGKVLFGGISVYLQQHSALFRHTPWLLDRLWDSRWALEAAARRSLSVNPRFLGEMTVSMLEGAEGRLAKEFRKFEHWLQGQDRPDIVTLPNALLIAMAPSIKRVYDGPVAVTMQGEDLFLGQLLEPYRSRARELIGRHVPAVDGFIAISAWYADHMAAYLGLPRERVHTVPLGVRTEDFTRAPERNDGLFRAGYLARIAPEKGLHLLAQAWREFRRSYTGPARLEAAGYLAPEHRPYLEAVEAELRAAGLAADFVFHGELGRGDKIRFLASLDAFCVPPVYDDPKGLYLLEAMASGVPVVAPARGALLEHVDACEGGLLVAPDDPSAIAGAFLELAENPVRARALGAAAHLGAGRHRSLPAMARRTLSVFQSLISGRAAAAPA